MTASAAQQAPWAQHRQTEWDRRRSVEQLGLLDAPAEDRFDRITRLARRLFGVQMAAITVLDEDRQWFLSRQGLDLTQVPRSWGFCDVALRTEGTLVVPDARTDQRFRDSPMVTGQPHVRFYAGCPLEVPGGHRLGTLCLMDDRPRQLSDDERQTLEDLAVAVQTELLHHQELGHGSQVQQALLPRTGALLPGYELAGLCLPMRSVGGDFWDWHPCHDGLAWTLADVMGKGVAAAIVMATVRAVLRATGDEVDVAQALRVADAALLEDLDETGTFVTLFHARLSPSDGLVQCVDAGHGLSLLVAADGSVQRITGPDLPLGVVPGAGFERITVVLQPGDTLVSVSDGFLELHAGADEGLAALAALTRSAGSAEDVVAGVQAAVAGRRLADDVTAVALRRILP